MNFAAPSSFYPSSFATDELQGAQLARDEAMAGMVGAAQLGKQARREAYLRASAWKAEADRQRRQQQRRSGIGGIAGILGTAASFIPGVGPAIGAGIGAIGKAIG